MSHRSTSRSSAEEIYMKAGTFVPMGRVARLQGLKGEVVVHKLDGVPFLVLEGMRVRFVPPPGSVRDTVVAGVRQAPRGTVVRFRGVGDPATAQSLVGRTIQVHAEDLPEGWDEPEWDPLGLVVVDEEHGEIGVIEGLIVTGANDVWVVRGERFGEVLVPDIEDVVLDVDEQTGTVTVCLLPGLLPEEPGADPAGE
jgi:16S rRNA processing protein RimM